MGAITWGLWSMAVGVALAGVVGSLIAATPGASAALISAAGVLALGLGMSDAGVALGAQLRLWARRAPPLPPGSMGWPYFGETLAYAGDPDTWYSERAARHGGVFRTSLLGAPTVVVADGAEGNRFVLANENRLFESRWPRSLRQLAGRRAVSMVPAGPAHRRLRRALSTFLNAHALRVFAHRVALTIDGHLSAHWTPAGKIVHVHPAVQKLAFELNADLFMGLKPGPRLDELRAEYETFTAGFEAQTVDLPWTVFGKAKRAKAVLLEHMLREIKARRGQLAASADEAKDFLDLLILSKDEETGDLYSEDEIADNMLLMVHVGKDTTASALAVTLKHLSLHPDILHKLRSACAALAASGNPIDRDELKKIPLLHYVINEGLRMYPSVAGVFKRAKREVVYNGFTIPKDWTVHLPLRHNHQNPDYFPNPHIFDPYRFEKKFGTFSYLPFGQGPRICPGMEFAKLTMELFFFHLITKYEWELVDPHEKIVVCTFSPYPEYGLPIKITRTIGS